MIFYELTRGLAYQRIRHPEAHWYARTLPAILTIASASFLLLLPKQPALLGKDGLVASSLTVISTLPGFYFAGLAAVATFAGLNMDAAMPAPAPTLRVTAAGAQEDLALSRRQFLSYLFSYLVLLSSFLCIGALVASAATPSIYAAKAGILSLSHGAAAWTIARACGAIAYLSLCSCLLVSTLHGIFFLSERIHQP